ncbi:Exonuc VIII superfamily incomplete domain containing protein [Pandoravirus celtis]|uniref:Exonuc VIII superfamily incomplete domain containing protein n=1 Tax=Pandoravirus celtis TaxID=2568002 RepID=A0A4D6EH56_9VIRU|nr:Exonuc VIII superfamily incomplete domain containing protein [Pandoravirus celtis]
MAKGRMRAWTERRARQKALAQPVPASQACPRCKACVRAGPDACPSCAAPLIAIVSDATHGRRNNGRGPPLPVASRICSALFGPTSEP